MVDERFIDIACEMEGVKCPSEVRRDELKKLVKEQFGEDAKSEEFLETQAGIVYRIVYEGDSDAQFYDGAQWKVEEIDGEG